MPAIDQKLIIDGFTTLLGAVDESRHPLLLRQDQASRAINITFRGGFLKTRPGFTKRNLKFERGEYGLWFIDHMFQGSEYYDTFNGMEKIVASVGGRIFIIDPSMGFMTSDITPRATTTTTANFTTNTSADVVVPVTDATKIFEGYPVFINDKQYLVASKSGNNLSLTNIEEVNGTVVTSGAVVEYMLPNSPNQPLAWFVQAEQYLIIQDGQSSAIIFDGTTTRRADPSGEIPSGTVMAYGQGRIWVAINNGREFVAGDIAGGPTGVLGFTENTYLAGGGSFRIPANAGKIRAMKFVMNLDTSLGQGPLQVLCERAIFSVNAPNSRELWAVVTSPIQTVSLINFGATSQNSTVLINGDLFFRAEDGLRSFVIARRDFGMWGNTPISREMNKVLDKDTPELLDHSCAVLFDNRLLFTAVPQPGVNGVHHKCLIALDFDLISTMASKSPPAYDGFWTGIEVTGFTVGHFAGRNRCFAFVHDGEGRNDFWEITRDAMSDNEDHIEWVLETRALAAGELKFIEGAEIWISEFIDDVTLTLQYRPDQYQCWLDWMSKEICIISSPCSETDACLSTTSGNMSGYKTMIGFSKPSDQNNLPNEQTIRVADSYQVRISGSGYAQMDKFKLTTLIAEDWTQQPPSDNRSECSTLSCCNPDPFSYESSCGKPQPPVLMNKTTGFAFGFRLAFRFEPDSTYELHGVTVVDGDKLIASFPNDVFEPWPDPDGWYEYNLYDLPGILTHLVAGDDIEFYMVVENACGQTMTSESVTATYTG